MQFVMKIMLQIPIYTHLRLRPLEIIQPPKIPALLLKPLT